MHEMRAAATAADGIEQVQRAQQVRPERLVGGTVECHISCTMDDRGKIGGQRRHLLPQITLDDRDAFARRPRDLLRAHLIPPGTEAWLGQQPLHAAGGGFMAPPDGEDDVGPGMVGKDALQQGLAHQAGHAGDQHPAVSGSAGHHAFPVLGHYGLRSA